MLGVGEKGDDIKELLVINGQRCYNRAVSRRSSLLDDRPCGEIGLGGHLIGRVG